MPVKAGWTPRWPHGITKPESSCPCCQPGIMDRQSRLRRRRERQLLDKQYEIIRSFYPSRSIPPSPLRIERTDELKLSDELIDNLLGRPDTRASSKKKHPLSEDEHQGNLQSDSSDDDDDDDDDMSGQDNRGEKQSGDSGRSGSRDDSVDDRDEDAGSEKSQESAGGSGDGRRDDDEGGDENKDKPQQNDTGDDQEAQEEAREDEDRDAAPEEEEAQATAAQATLPRDSVARDSLTRQSDSQEDSASQDSMPRDTPQATPARDLSSQSTPPQETPSQDAASDGTTARESTTRDDEELPDAPPLVNAPPSDSLDEDDISPTPTDPVVIDYDCIVVKTEEGCEPDASLPTHVPIAGFMAEKPRRKPLPSGRPRREEAESERATSRETLPQTQTVERDPAREPQSAHSTERDEPVQTSGNQVHQQSPEVDTEMQQDEPHVEHRQQQIQQQAQQQAQQQPQYKVVGPSVRQRLPARRPYTQPRLRRKRNWQQQAIHNQWQDIERQAQQRHLSSVSPRTPSSGLPQQMFPPPPPGFSQHQRVPPLGRSQSPVMLEDPEDPGSAVSAAGVDAFWDRALQKLRQENDKRHPRTQAMPMQKPLPTPHSQQQQQQQQQMQPPAAAPMPWERLRQQYLQQELKQREIQGQEMRDQTAERELKSQERQERERRELELQERQVRELTELHEQQKRQEQEERDRLSRERSQQIQRPQAQTQAQTQTQVRRHTLPVIDKEKQKQDDMQQMILVQEKRQQERLQQERLQREKLQRDRRLQEQRLHVHYMQNERIQQVMVEQGRQKQLQLQQQQLQKQQEQQQQQRHVPQHQQQHQPHHPQQHQPRPQSQPQPHLQMQPQHHRFQQPQQPPPQPHHQQHQPVQQRQRPQQRQQQQQPEYRHEKKMQHRYQHHQQHQPYQQSPAHQQRSPQQHQHQQPLPREQEQEPVVYITRSERLVATPDGTVMRARQHRDEARRRAVEAGRERMRRLDSGEPLLTVRPGDQKEAPDGTYEVLQVEQDCIPPNCDPLPLPGLYSKMPCPCCNMFIRKDRSILPEDEYGRPEKGRGKEYIPMSLLYDMLPPPPKGYPFLNDD